ncbi:hypothetical protein RB614_13330 [Phytohabitans sp. ZYX-F-186]|uniref:DUF222 domain-containing protein n=1 Tax=Phytohabitans maris TaxID=3071409 RepID=A0ABU0ZEM1_9ACTN|nr:hypothetical protein [Phytohabitans sp. ZYX-F-186]MDQ7905506.1 hypothetical protein [Phytohabitans sp. ZYX-F-186]
MGKGTNHNGHAVIDRPADAHPSKAPTVSLPALVSVPSHFISTWARTGALDGDVHLVPRPSEPPAIDRLEASQTGQSEHREVAGWKGDGPGTCGVECACGVTFANFDTLAEANNLLADHITRADAETAKVAEMADRLANVLAVADVLDDAGTPAEVRSELTAELRRMAGNAIAMRLLADTQRSLNVRDLHPAWCAQPGLADACGHSHISKWTDVAATFNRPKFTGAGTAEYPALSVAARLEQDPADIVGPDTDGQWYGTGSVTVKAHQVDGEWCEVRFTPAEWQRFAELAEDVNAMAAGDLKAATRPLPEFLARSPEAVREQIEREKHPWWCDGSSWCGEHRSAYRWALASATGFEPVDGGALVPAVGVAAEVDEQGRRGVVLVLPKFEVSLTVAEIAALVEAGDEARLLVAAS